MLEHLVERAAANASSHTAVNTADNAMFKTVGIILALSSGVFIGTSFVFKKKGLLEAQKEGAIAGQGHAYLSNGLWWTGMILMIIGEVCNFVAYAFTQAILVTPLGALSVVISAVLSSIFLKEKLSFDGKIGCALCIIGATIIVVHAPSTQVANSIDEFRQEFFRPLLTFIIIWRVAPKWGSKNMLVYIGVCSMIGSLSVVTTQGLGTAIVTTIMDPSQNQLTNWFFYVVAAFVVVTLLTEINYLNKALNIFNTAMVTPVYYVLFTGLTIISSAILSNGFNAPPVSIATVVLGFLVICNGIVLLQTSKGASMDGRQSILMSNDHDSPPVMMSSGENEPGALDIRASFGSLRRFSSHGRTHPTNHSNTYPNPNNLQRRTQSLNYGPSMTMTEGLGLSSIVERSSSLSDIKKAERQDSTSVVLTDGEFRSNRFSNQSQDSTLARNSFIRFLSSPSSIDEQPTSPHGQNQHTFTSTILSRKNSSASPESPHSDERVINIPPIPSPLHPIDFIRQHLSPTNSVFDSSNNNNTVTSESYSGITPSNLNRSASASGKKSQSIGFVDKFKLGIGDQDEDTEGLVSSNYSSGEN
ncbi:18860_t:CDS:2 [Gigaspora margarita]|uniref:18860_t:CDS:1 n=1 Tax=Gigaspora margarita TaxID=4874 RepID=A0ABN7UKC1_GIGMA|nr:18860_t:CDS:2 [Gigaspora margarita]